MYAYQNSGKYILSNINLEPSVMLTDFCITFSEIRLFISIS